VEEGSAEAKAADRDGIVLEELVNEWISATKAGGS
jgi:hypothetical protein